MSFPPTYTPHLSTRLCGVGMLAKEADCGRIKQDTGERGWVPAWFIGKLCSGEEKGLAVVAASGDGAEEELKDEH